MNFYDFRKAGSSELGVGSFLEAMRMSFFQGKKYEKMQRLSEILMAEAIAVKKQRAKKIIAMLEKTYPDAKCALHFQTPFQLLVAVQLSAQCTDKQVNTITPKLFSALPTAESFARAPLEIIETLIHSTGFYRNKARNLKGAAVKIARDFDGEIPSTMKELLSLPGIGRKSANVILETGFQKVEGIVVDTHVNRLMTKRLQLVPKKMEGKAEKIEQELMKILPRKKWGQVGHLFVAHGRNLCIARRPKCAKCPLVQWCPGNEL